jgi:hypothetical protein
MDLGRFCMIVRDLHAQINRSDTSVVAHFESHGDRIKKGKYKTRFQSAGLLADS